VLEGTLALVYAEGSQTRWVVLLVQGPHHQWSQTVNYFYGTDNRLVKRERYLDQVPANTALQEFLYYQQGRVFSKMSSHHPLKAGREDTSQFDDPNAPEFGSVDELPFPDDADAEWPLAMRELSTPFHKYAKRMRVTSLLRGRGSVPSRVRQQAFRIRDRTSKVDALKRW
jgi:hypothetical protein